MAITKIHAIKSTLGKALAYIENPDKTDGQMLVSGYNCEPQTASIDFEMTAVLEHKARNLKRKRSTNLAYHLIQSFSPEDAVTPEQAHELGKGIINNSKTKIILNLEDDEAQRVQEALHLSDAETMEITHFERGHGLISTNNNNIMVEFKASPLEKDLITTDRRELREIVERKRREQSTSAEQQI